MRLQGIRLQENLRLKLKDEFGLNRQECAELRCQLARELEAAGEYEDARETLGDLWPGIGERPHVEELEPRIAAELLLRAGNLTGRFGKGKAIEGAQEAARDLISESMRLFEEMGDLEKVAETQSDLANCYWQEGAYDEASAAIAVALSLLEDSDSPIKALAIVRSAAFKNSAGRQHEAYRFLRAEGTFISTFNTFYLSGLYHSTLANTLLYFSANEKAADLLIGETTEESYANRALVEYTAASFHFEQAGHSRHAARVRNNTAYLLFTLGRFKEAHENLDLARRLFQSLEEHGSVAQIDDTRARVLLAQKRDVDAERIARQAVTALEKGDDAAQLAQALTTHGHALARIGRYNDAKSSFERAIETATGYSDREGAGQACLAMIEELADVLPPLDVWSRYEQADQLLSDSERPETISRLRACARIAFIVGRRALRSDLEDSWHGCVLADEVLRYEGELIKQAMAAENGSISRAAKRLGTTHQGLRNIISGRQKSLLGKEYAPRPRKRSIIKSSRPHKRAH